MIYAIYLLVGALLGSGFVFLVQRSGVDVYGRFGIALLVAAGIYAAFAMAAMESTWLMIELIGVGLFGVLVQLVRRKVVSWLAAGWALHALWDVGHLISAGAEFVPDWYPALCITFDLVVAFHIARGTQAESQRRHARVAP